MPEKEKETHREREKEREREIEREREEERERERKRERKFMCPLLLNNLASLVLKKWNLHKTQFYNIGSIQC